MIFGTAVKGPPASYLDHPDLDTEIKTSDIDTKHFVKVFFLTIKTG